MLLLPFTSHLTTTYYHLLRDEKEMKEMKVVVADGDAYVRTVRAARLLELAGERTHHHQLRITPFVCSEKKHKIRGKEKMKKCRVLEKLKRCYSLSLSPLNTSSWNLMRLTRLFQFPVLSFAVVLV